MTIIYNYPKYLAKVRNNATALRTELDTKMSLRDIPTEKYSPHLENCIHHPTTGLIARHEYINYVQKNYPSYFSKNLHYVENRKEYKYLANILDDRLNQLYPKTKKLRQFLIDENHLSLYFVKSKHKLGLWSKIRLLFIR